MSHEPRRAQDEIREERALTSEEVQRIDACKNTLERVADLLHTDLQPFSEERAACIDLEDIDAALAAVESLHNAIREAVLALEGIQERAEAVERKIMKHRKLAPPDKAFLRKEEDALGVRMEDILTSLADAQEELEHFRKRRTLERLRRVTDVSAMTQAEIAWNTRAGRKGIPLHREEAVRVQNLLARIVHDLENTRKDLLALEHVEEELEMFILGNP